LKDCKLEDGLQVTTRYKDLAGESYESEWTLDPLLFEGSVIETSKGMNDLVGAVDHIAEAIVQADRHHEHQSGWTPEYSSSTHLSE
jgi:hypothetical protein